MKKYNLSKIMKRAWELVKKIGATISEALKRARKEAKDMMEKKGGTKMNGTRKQIAWAEDIIATAYDGINAYINSDIEDISKAGMEVKRIYDNIVAKYDDAAYFIENRERFSKLYITYKAIGSTLRKMGSKYRF